MADTLKKRYDKKAFQTKILKLDPICMCPHCNNPAVSGHHIIYKSQWSDLAEYALTVSRDSADNGIGLCAECHYKCHNGDGINGISGREFTYNILNFYNKKTGYYYRWLKMKAELKKSLIRKGVDCAI